MGFHDSRHPVELRGSCCGTDLGCVCGGWANALDEGPKQRTLHLTKVDLFPKNFGIQDHSLDVSLVSQCG